MKLASHEELDQTTAYVWQGTDAQGQAVSGDMISTSPAMVKAILRRQGITPIEVRRPRVAFFQKRKTNITRKDIAVFTRQLAAMLQAGIPIVQALEIVIGSCENTAMKKLILTLKKSITGGSSLYEAFAQHPAYFNELYCHLVPVSYTHLTLPTILLV